MAVIVAADTTVAEIDEALSHLRERWDQAGPAGRIVIGPRIDALLDARNALDHAS